MGYSIQNYMEVMRHDGGCLGGGALGGCGGVGWLG